MEFKDQVDWSSNQFIGFIAPKYNTKDSKYSKAQKTGIRNEEEEETLKSMLRYTQ